MNRREGSTVALMERASWRRIRLRPGKDCGGARLRAHVLQTVESHTPSEEAGMLDPIAKTFEHTAAPLLIDGACS
eukprot:6177992-Pleurochrysis_carterae.AAC.2